MESLSTLPTFEHIPLESDILFYFWESILQIYLHNYTTCITRMFSVVIPVMHRTSKSNSVDAIWHHENRLKLNKNIHTIPCPHTFKRGKPEYTNVRLQRIIPSWLLELVTMISFLLLKAIKFSKEKFSKFLRKYTLYLENPFSVEV